MSIPETSFFPAQRFPFFLCGFDMKCLQINFILVGLSIDIFEILSVFPVLVFLRMKEIFKIRQKFVKKSLGRGDERKPCPMASVSGGCVGFESAVVSYRSARSAHLLRRPCENIMPVGIRPIAKRFSMAGCWLQFSWLKCKKGSADFPDFVFFWRGLCYNWHT